MLEITWFEARERLLGSTVLAVGFGGFAGLVMLIAPGVIADADFEALLAQLPPAVIESMGLRALGSVEGFLAIEVYQFTWVIGLGGYLAYTGAATIAGDIETNEMDTLLAAPIARWQVVVEKFLALLTPVVMVNGVTFAAVAGTATAIDEPVSIADLGMVHLLSLPYLLACGAIGILASVLAAKRLTAEGLAAGTIVGTFLLESIVETTEYEVVGAIAPMRYYEPLTILTQSRYDYAGAAILAAATVVLVTVSAWRFSTQDIQ